MIDSSAPQLINKPEHRLSMEFPSDWQVEHEDKNRNNRIVVAHPSYPFDTDVSLTLAIHSKRDSALDDVVKFELEYKRDLEAGTDTILVSEPTEVSGHKGHKIVYNSRYEMLVDKVMKIWFSANNTIYEITYEAPNPQKYDYYLDTAMKIIDSIKI